MSDKKGKQAQGDKGRKPINIAMVGPHNSGKSTLAGLLVYKCGGIEKRAIEKFEKEAAKIGKASYKYAWVFDTLEVERKKGTTIVSNSLKFQTDKYNITLIVTPGLPKYMNNMITGLFMYILVQ